MSETQLEAAINYLYTLIAGLSIFRKVYVDPPESLNEFPCAICYLSEGEMMPSSPNLHTFAIDTYSQRATLPEAVNEGKKWVDTIFIALKGNMTLNGKVSHWVKLRYRAQAMPYNNMTHYGFRFYLTVKIVDVN